MQCDIIEFILNYYHETGKWISSKRIADYFGVNRKFAIECVIKAREGMPGK